ncbi:hypothetical protein ABBQ38_008527 [Trebouxia sp. C0009 RCD-2024]
MSFDFGHGLLEGESVHLSSMQNRTAFIKQSTVDPGLVDHSGDFAMVQDARAVSAQVPGLLSLPFLETEDVDVILAPRTGLHSIYKWSKAHGGLNTDVRLCLFTPKTLPLPTFQEEIHRQTHRQSMQLKRLEFISDLSHRPNHLLMYRFSLDATRHVTLA